MLTARPLMKRKDHQVFLADVEIYAIQKQGGEDNEIKISKANRSFDPFIIFIPPIRPIVFIVPL